MNARAKSPEDSVLDALAAALAPRVARLLREQHAAKDSEQALEEMLAEAGFELDTEAP